MNSGSVVFVVYGGFEFVRGGEGGLGGFANVTGLDWTGLEVYIYLTYLIVLTSI